MLPQPPDVETPFRLSPKLAFLLELGRCLQVYGAPAHRLEEALARVARRLGMDGQVFCVPTGFFAFIGEQGHRQRTYLERTEPGGPNLAKLSDVYEVAREVALGRLQAEPAHERLKRIQETPPPFGAGAFVICSAIASGTAARFFGGGWMEMCFGAMLGLLAGIVPMLAERRKGLKGFTVAVGAFAVSLVAALMALLGLKASPALLTLAGLFNYLPGIGLVIAMNELATGHLVSGTARVAGTFMVFLQLAFGVALGHHVGSQFLPPGRAAALTPLGEWTLLPSMVLAAASYLVLFQARRQDFGWILAACALGFYGSRLGALMLGPEFGVGLGALALGIGSNLWSRRYDRPSLTTVLPGLMLLVPGSWGFRSLGFFFQDQVMMGFETLIRMVILATALLAGLMLANAVVRPRMVL